MSGVILPKSFALLRKLPCHGLLALPNLSSWSCKRTLYVTKVRLIQPVSDLFTNPIDRLQPMLQIPIIPDSDLAFKPTRDEMEAASLMFEPKNMKGETFKFLGSWPNPHIMPKWTIPEV